MMEDKILMPIINESEPTTEEPETKEEEGVDVE